MYGHAFVGGGNTALLTGRSRSRAAAQNRPPLGARAKDSLADFGRTFRWSAVRCLGACSLTAVKRLNQSSHGSIWVIPCCSSCWIWHGRVSAWHDCSQMMGAFTPGIACPAGWFSCLTCLWSRVPGTARQRAGRCWSNSIARNRHTVFVGKPAGCYALALRQRVGLWCGVANAGGEAGGEHHYLWAAATAAGCNDPLP